MFRIAGGDQLLRLTVREASPICTVESWASHRAVVGTQVFDSLVSHCNAGSVNAAADGVHRRPGGVHCRRSSEAGLDRALTACPLYAIPCSGVVSHLVPCPMSADRTGSRYGPLSWAALVSPALRAFGSSPISENGSWIQYPLDQLPFQTQNDAEAGGFQSALAKSMFEVAAKLDFLAGFLHCAPIAAFHAHTQFANNVPEGSSRCFSEAYGGRR